MSLAPLEPEIQGEPIFHSDSGGMRREDHDPGVERSARVGHCHHPVKLTGQSHTIDRATGVILSSVGSAELPDGVLYVKCGNRRASACAPCSREYGADMWHLLRAGAAGGDKGIPTSVVTHPMVFATLTAPSFGPVHAVKRPGSRSRRCRPRSRGERCPHGINLSCMAVHQPGDLIVGQPFCVQCYDYEAHVVWQWWAPELWRRFTIALPRAIAKALNVSQKVARKLVRVSFAKVGEYQQRGIIHFHAIIRLDGPPDDDQAFPPPRIDVESGWLADRVHEAAGRVEFDAPPAYRHGPDHRLTFGTQVDARPVHVRAGRDDLAGPIHPETVAAYIAKYSTKSAADLDPGDRGASNAHLARLRRSVLRLADGADELYPPGGPFDNPYTLLGKWGHMLGFRGHFASKSRRYSTTLTRIRGARRRFQRAKARSPHRTVDVALLDRADEEETTLVVGSWRFAGTGWLTDEDTEVAVAAAARARERALSRRTNRQQGPTEGKDDEHERRA